MTKEYFKPMLDVGSPRVFNINVMTRRLAAKDPAMTPFFRNKPLNNLVLVKDSVPENAGGPDMMAIGTKLYIPFNENNIYEGGRTIFAHDKHLSRALLDHFGEGALAKEDLAEDLRLLAILDRLPSLDPFLLKDVFLNEGIKVNQDYFEVSEEIWREIETFILLRFEPLVRAAFPDIMQSDEKARQLVEKIWEARDLDALDPLIKALRLPREEALQIFSAWKGIIFYSFQSEQAKPLFIEMLTWIKDLEIPIGVSVGERNELKATLDTVRGQLRNDWQKADTILREYQDSYDKMFKLKVTSADFVAFLRKSRSLYWELGNSLGKTGHASYCWDVSSRRFKERKLPWEQLKEIIQLLTKIFKSDKKIANSMTW